MDESASREPNQAPAMGGGNRWAMWREKGRAGMDRGQRQGRGTAHGNKK